LLLFKMRIAGLVAFSADGEDIVGAGDAEVSGSERFDRPFDSEETITPSSIAPFWGGG
jgi:hypothetical protein